MIKIALLMTASSLAYVSEHPETIKIKRNGDVYTINLDDYDEKRDGKPVTDEDLGIAPAPNTASAPAPGIVVPPAPSAPGFIDAVAPATVHEDTYSLVKKGKKFIVVRATDGEPVKGFKDIDEAGYNTDTEAWAAIMAVKKDPHGQSIEPPRGNFPDAEAIENAANEADGKTE